MSKTVREVFHDAGYDQEEDYFYRFNRALADQLKRGSASGGKPVDVEATLKMAAQAKAVAHRPFAAVLGRILAAVTRPLPSGIGQFPV